MLLFVLAVTVLSTLSKQVFRERAAPFSSPSENMSPTLIPGDQFFVLSDRDRHPIERGSVIVNRGERGYDYVRRVVALEGDLVEWDGETLKINARPLPVGVCEPGAPSGCHTEQLGRHRWRVLTTSERSLQGSWEVPEGHVFALGDNREKSLDSRSVGPVPLESVKGVAQVIHFSWPTVSRMGRPLDLAPE